MNTRSEPISPGFGRWALGGRRDSRRVRLSSLTAVSVASYFASSVLYYVEAVPLGHLINLAFGLVFGVIVLLADRTARVSGAEFAAIGWACLLAITSATGWVVREGWAPDGLARSVTWLTPALMIMAIRASGTVNMHAVCTAVGLTAIGSNLIFTLGFANFNPDLGKFEVDLGWTGISSNELSFHLIAFGALFFWLGGSTRVGMIVVGLSLIHLSKAHIGSLVLSPLVSLCRSRIWLTVAILAGVVLVLRWIAAAAALDEMVIPSGLQRVFGPLLDLTRVAGEVVGGQWTGQLLDLAGAVGLYRFEVYEAAVALLLESPFGHSAAVVDQVLLGLDPHSNVLYLALREGWLVALGYVGFILACMFLVPWRGRYGKAAVAGLAYILIRTSFLTFDPVRIVAVGAFVLVCVSMRSGRGRDDDAS